MKAEDQHKTNEETIAKVKEIQGAVQTFSVGKTKELQQKAAATFRNLTIMIWVTFVLGLVLILSSLLLFVVKQQTLTILGMGGLGVADFAALFFYKPMDKLQDADKDFVEQLIILKSWALSVNLELLAMDANKRETVITASENIRKAATWSARTIQDLISSQTPPASSPSPKASSPTPETPSGSTSETTPKPGQASPEKPVS